MSWTNGQFDSNKKWTKLDRALTNLPFIQQFALTKLEYMARKSFYQKPMLLSISPPKRRYGLAPFGYQNIWSCS